MTSAPRPAARSAGRWVQLKLATFIALRIARSKRSTSLSLVTLISIVGIACGVLALTVVLSVTNGFQAAFQDRILGVFPHLIVTRASSIFRDYEPVLESILKTPGVVGATPLTGDEMMVAHGVFRGGATVQGVDLATVRGVLDIDRLMVEGRLDDLDETATVTAQGDGLSLGEPVSGASLTLVHDGTKPFVLVDERTNPDADHARFKVLDLRPEDERRAIELIPKGGVATTVYELKDPVLLFGRPDAWSTELELPQGEWVLTATNERLSLDAPRAYAIVLYKVGPELRSAFLTEEASAVIPEREALVRVVDVRPSGAAIAWRSHDARPIVTTRPGESSSYRVVSARLPGVLLGKTLAERLRAKPGSELSFVTPLRGLDNKTIAPFGMMPSSARFRVVGIFEAGFHEHDSRLALINIGVSQRFMNRGRLIRTIAVRASSLLEVDKTKRALVRTLDPIPFEALVERTQQLDEKLTLLLSGETDARLSPPTQPAPFLGGLRNLTTVTGLLKFQGVESLRPNRFQVFDWREKNINLFSALELQKVVLAIFFFIIILVGSFVVVGSQIMVVHEKTPDIAILKAMGATSGLVRLVFTLQGLFVALIGLVAGLVFGLGLVWLIDAVDYQLEASIYLIDKLPATIDGLELAFVALGALVCTLLTTQISAGRAASKSPVAGLRQVD